MGCEVCGMSFAPDYGPDMREHRRYHEEYVNGVKLQPLRNDQVLYDVDGFRVTHVPPTAPVVHRRRAERVGRRANRETHYDFGVYQAGSEANADYNIQVFIGHRQERGVALLVLSRRRHGWRATWTDYDLHRPPKKITERREGWTVDFVWVLPKHRGQGLASRLLLVATAWAGASVTELAWQTPFEDAGARFVRRHCPLRFYIPQ